MILHDPFAISARLLPAVKIGDSWLSVEWSPKPGREGRARYRFHLDTPTFEYTDDELQSGCQGGTLQQGMGSFLTFLSYAAEHARYWRGREADDPETALFPPQVIAWADHWSDEIDVLAYAIEETPDLIEED